MIVDEMIRLPLGKSLSVGLQDNSPKRLQGVFTFAF